MFKIGEFSKLTQVSIRMLRYYDERNLLKPARIDTESGYRFYAVEQIPILNKIIYLRDSGFRVAEIAEALQEDSMPSLLDKKYAEIKHQIEEEEQKLKKIELARQAWQSGMQPLHYQINIKSIPSYHVLSIRRVIPNYYAEGTLWKELERIAQAEKIEYIEPSFSIYHDEDYREENVDVEVCVPIKGQLPSSSALPLRDTESIPAMACMLVYGAFSNIAGAYQAFAGWLQNQSEYQMKNPSRQIVHRGPWNEPDVEKWLTEIQIPIIKK